MIRFWEDSKSGGLYLCRVFPDMYRIASSNGAMVVDF